MRVQVVHVWVVYTVIHDAVVAVRPQVELQPNARQPFEHADVHHTVCARALSLQLTDDARDPRCTWSHCAAARCEARSRARTRGSKDDPISL